MIYDYSGYIMIRAIIVLLLIAMLILNLLYLFYKKKKIAVTLKIVAPLCSFIITGWLIYHTKGLIIEIYKLAISERNRSEMIIDVLVFNNTLFLSELFISFISLIFLFISGFIHSDNKK